MQVFSRACMAFVLVIDVQSGKNVLSLKDFSYLLFLVIIIFSTDIAISCQS